MTETSTLFCLRKREDFVTATKHGKRCSTPAFLLQLVGGLTPHIGYGLTASRKGVGGAVERNRAKRRLRVLVRELLPRYGKQNHTYVFVARKQVLKRPFEKLKADVVYALKKIHQESKDNG